MMSRRTVAHYVHAYLRRTEPWIHDQITFLRATRSIVLTKHVIAPLPMPSLPVYAIPGAGFARTMNELVHLTRDVYPLFERACVAECVDVLHAHFGNRALEILPLAKALRLPVVTSFYGRDLSFAPRGRKALAEQYEELFAVGEGFMVEGPAARRHLIELGCPEEKIEIHRLAIDLAQHPFSLRERNASDPLCILMAARFTTKKGFEYGVESFARVARRDARLHLTIVGDAVTAGDRLVRDRIQSIVRQYGIADRVTFRGFVSRAELDAISRSHHLLLHPSVVAPDGDSEGGHPVVMTELAATGMPIIATRHDDIPEVVIDGESGWLCDERSIDQLEEAIIDAANSPEKLARFSSCARALVEKKYSSAGVHLDQTYQRVADRAREPLSVLITTFNERDQIDDCLRSVEWADEIYLIDSFSTDQTVQYVRSAFPRVRIEQRRYEAGAAEQKNHAIRRLSHDWVLVVDADERVTAELRSEIRLALRSPRFPAYSIRRRNFVLGAAVRFSGLQNDRVTRLFDRRRARYPARLVHADLVADGPTAGLRAPFDHYYVRSLDHMAAKMTRYATWGAIQSHEAGRRGSWFHVVSHTGWRLFRDGFIRFGFLDGMRGIIVVGLHTYYTFWKYVKLWDLSREEREGRTAHRTTPASADRLRASNSRH